MFHVQSNISFDMTIAVGFFVWITLKCEEDQQYSHTKSDTHIIMTLVDKKLNYNLIIIIKSKYVLI